jgi:hypothetical protein
MPYLLDYPVEDFREMLDTNPIGPFLLIKNTLPAIIERGGSIINVTSDAGQVDCPGWGAYDVEIWPRRHVANVGIGVARERRASGLGRSRLDRIP